MDPSGKVALVTGGASGIGLAVIKELLQSGANVAICDVNGKLGEEKTKEFVTQYGKDRAIFIKTDITKETEFEDAFKKTIEHFKALNIVFNNAGIFDDAHWDREVEINLKGVIRGTLLALKYMGKDNGAEGGVIVNTASVLGLDSSACAPIYTATKHGVVGLSQSLGLPFHFDRTGVSVLTLCPSATLTPLFIEGSKHTLLQDWKEDIKKEVVGVPVVKPDVVGQSFMHIIQVAKSGSVWISEGDETYRVNLPDYKSLRSDD